jgi:hypothetical protein
MRRGTVHLVCALVCLAVAEPVSAMDVPVPMPTLPADAATAVSTATADLVDVELPTIAVPVPAADGETVTPPSAPAEAASTLVEAASGQQYQPEEPQYQPDEEAPVATLPTVDITPATTPSPSVDDEADDPVAGVDTTVSTPTLPETWTWTWTWNCDGASSLPAPPAGVTGWAWNWNWDCNATAVPALDLGQYQSPITQYQPENTNIGIRIASPGDDGPVTQTISTVTQVTTTLVTEVVQRVVQVTPAPPPLVVVVGPTPLPPLPLPSVVLPAAIAPTIEAATAPTFVLPLPTTLAEPSLGSPLELVLPAARPGRGGGRPPAAPASSFGPSAFVPAAALPSIVTRAPGADAGAGPRPRRAPAPEPRRRPLPPIPGGQGLAAGHSASASALALAAVAAMVAAYLLVPPPGVRRLRRSRDRRRLGLLAAPLERPG